MNQRFEHTRANGDGISSLRGFIAGDDINVARAHSSEAEDLCCRDSSMTDCPIFY